MTAQEVIALATLNVRLAERGEKRKEFPYLESHSAAALKTALAEATHILEALDAAGWHVTGKVEGAAEAAADAAALDVSALDRPGPPCGGEVGSAQGNDPYLMIGAAWGRGLIW